MELLVRIGCPDCKNSQANYIEYFASGILVCNDCGCVIGNNTIDTCSE